MTRAPVWSGHTAAAPAAVRDRIRRPATAKTLVAVFLVTGAAPFPGSGAVVFATGLLALCHAWAANRIEPPSRLLLALLAWCAASVLWSVAPSLTVRGVLITTTTVLAVYSLVSHLPRAHVFWALGAALKVLIVLSWIAYLALPSLGREQVLYQQGALKGVFIQRNTAAFVMAVAVLTFAVLAVAAATAEQRLSALCWVVVAFVTLLMTSSGTGLVVTVSSLLLLAGVIAVGRRSALTRRSVLLVVVGIAAAAAVSVQQLLPLVTGLLGRDSTLTGRTLIWETVGPYIAQQPWLGYGWSALWTAGVPVTEQLWATARFEFSHAHSSYLDASVQVGYVGVALLVLVCLATLVRAARLLALEREAAAARWPVAVTVCLMLYGIAELSLMSYFGLLLVVTALALVGRAHPDRVDPPAARGLPAPASPHASAERRIRPAPHPIA